MKILSQDDDRFVYELRFDDFCDIYTKLCAKHHVQSLADMQVEFDEIGSLVPETLEYLMDKIFREIVENLMH